MTNSVINVDVLRKILRYDDASGKLFWLQRQAEQWPSDLGSLQRWNGRYAGTQALCAVKSRGYLHGTIFGKTYLAHRVAWALWSGNWPTMHIDHIDGDHQNNRIENLREASRSQNMQNSKSAKGATSVYLGVSRKSSSGKWCAQIQTEVGKKHIGYFEDEREAARAYDRAALARSPQFARLNFPEVVSETELMGQAVTIRLDPLAAKRAVA
jgi:hypothetical protein